MKKGYVVIGLIGLLLIGVSSVAYINWKNETRHTQELEEKIKVLQQQEQLSAVDRSVSRQMEEIAFQQQTISEKRRQEAVEQSLIAQEMTRRSEEERQKAETAQKAAEASAKEAREAYLQAEHQRLQAEYSKRVADTLYYISLGRSLGTQAYTLYRAGDTEIGNLLAYASLVFTKKYGGDLYISAVFQALTQSSKSIRNRSLHNGHVSAVKYSPDSNRLLSVSTYGEIFEHEKINGQLVSKRLFQDNNYDFRDAYILSTGKYYGISRTGHLIIINNGKTEILPLVNVKKPFKLQHMNNHTQLLIVGENSLALLDMGTNKIIGTRQLDYEITTCNRVDNKPLLFDSKGRMHVVNSLDDLTTSKVPVSSKITAYACSKNEHLQAYGTADGTIYLVDKSGKMSQLKGHLSRITKLNFNGKRLYSTSYDGKLLFWLINDNQIAPITLYQTDNWLLDFTYDNPKEFIWIGEANGDLTEYLISIKLIQERIRKNLKRDFTQEEWNYYIGKRIPYRSFMNQD